MVIQGGEIELETDFSHIKMSYYKRLKIRDYIKKRKRTKQAPKSRTMRIRNLPPNLGCIECDCLDVKINSESVTCVECGLKVSLDDYFDYCDDLIKRFKAEEEKLNA